MACATSPWVSASPKYGLGRITRVPDHRECIADAPVTIFRCEIMKAWEEHGGD